MHAPIDLAGHDARIYVRLPLSINPQPFCEALSRMADALHLVKARTIRLQAYPFLSSSTASSAEMIVASPWAMDSEEVAFFHEMVILTASEYLCQIKGVSVERNEKPFLNGDRSGMRFSAEPISHQPDAGLYVSIIGTVWIHG